MTEPELYRVGQAVEWRGPFSDPDVWHPGIFEGRSADGMARVGGPGVEMGLVSANNIRPADCWAARRDRDSRGFDKWWDSLPLKRKIGESRELAEAAWRASRAALRVVERSGL